ncbi:hypothetical protein [Micromonospora tarensis]|uniref:Uncharacterized protein n=1 Tax=Micromonospora tarensis TaxID=2806100 RepID=A0ABS1YD65_9ACTN|nr:hypothetical protein [Micromonospora tarensis]MBM0275310.1 hypothetical protein [Micromonospora tarensis]
MGAAFAICVITLVALLAWVAHLKNKRMTAVLLVVLAGALIGNAPGNVGDVGQTLSDFVYDIPTNVSEIVDGS